MMPDPQISPRLLLLITVGSCLIIAAVAVLLLTSQPGPPLSAHPGGRLPLGSGKHRSGTAADAPAGTTVRQSATPAVPLDRMIGQLVMVRMAGLTADSGLLARLRDGQVGGVILYGANVSSRAQVHALVSDLQGAARAGGNPPLLISTDQEGGQIARLPWAGPAMTPEQMGSAGNTPAHQEGLRTGAALRASGVNVNLAPVVDVGHSPQAFIWKQGRSFGLSARSVTNSAVPFGVGLQDARVAATAKHFPGVGGASIDTDFAFQSLNDEPRDIQPYQVAIPDGISVIMVSTAAYPNLDLSGTAAALSQPIVTGLLRDRLHFAGVIMSDDLERPTGYSTAGAVVRAAAAGINILLVSSTEEAGPVAYSALLAAARAGRLPAATITDSYRRVIDLKRRYAA